MARDAELSRLVLGTAQFGMPYGILGQGSPVGLSEVREILQWCLENGIRRLDTAAAYGSSEETLGRIGIQDFTITTKLPRIPEGTCDVAKWVETEIKGSLHRLRIDRLDTVLLHHPGDILSAEGPEIEKALSKLRTNGVIGSLGVSIYDPNELGPLEESMRIEVVQAPLNAFDQRLDQTGWLDRLANNEIEIQTRSVFLQGLLLTSPEALPDKFKPWLGLWQEWWAFVSSTKLSAIEVALAEVMKFPQISGVVVGCESKNQIAEIMQSESNLTLIPGGFVADAPFDVVDPRRWASL